MPEWVLLYTLDQAIVLMKMRECGLSVSDIYKSVMGKDSEIIWLLLPNAQSRRSQSLPVMSVRQKIGASPGVFVP
jgi:hypothetical protein